MTKLFIGGFPLDITELEIVQIVAPYAEVMTIKLVRDRATKKCKGYAFLEVQNEEQAKAAMQALDGVVSGDRVLSLNIVDDQPTEATNVTEFGSPTLPVSPQRTKRPRRPRL